MKQSTIQKYIKILKDIKESGKNIATYCKENNMKVKNIYNTIQQLKKQNNEESETVSELLTLYNNITKTNVNCRIEDIQQEPICTSTEENVETDDTAETSYIRDNDGKIKYYKYQIFRRDKAPLCGRLTREEMNTIHRLYSYYGDSLTQRVVSRYFVDLSLIDFKRILRAFNITKASAPFAPHMFEEKSEEELRDIQLREKENSFLRKAEEDQIKNNEKLLRKYAQENIELKKKIDNCANITLDFPEALDLIHITHKSEIDNQSINIYLSDMHIGAAMQTGCLYEENINYGKEEVKRRLTTFLNKLAELGTFEHINLVLLGDQVDCCGVYGKTASLTHDLPENMDVREQANTYLEIMLWLVDSIIKNDLCNNLTVYSVPCGNHSGTFEYVINKAIMYAINAKFPNVKTWLWDKEYGVFRFHNHTFVCMHGKALFMKKGFPLNIDDRTKVLIYEWLDSQNIKGDNIHIIKGDLHSNNMNSCLMFDYRNVLSLFGSSDYGANFSRNAYGISYDLFIGNNLVRGTFENL